jgi:hypothetical protein
MNTLSDATISAYPMTLGKPLNMLTKLLLLPPPDAGYHLNLRQTTGYLQPTIPVFPFTLLSRLKSLGMPNTVRDTDCTHTFR